MPLKEIGLTNLDFKFLNMLPHTILTQDILFQPITKNSYLFQGRSLQR